MLKKEKAVLKELADYEMQVHKFDKRLKQEKEYKVELENEVIKQQEKIKILEMQKKMKDDAEELQ